jgi:iron complex outermembrane receptor protein
MAMTGLASIGCTPLQRLTFQREELGLVARSGLRKRGGRWLLPTILAYLPCLLLALPPSAIAQQEPVDATPHLSITVTGSNIPRTDLETALPVQRITREDIDRSGANTAAELLTFVSANLIGQNDARSIGNSQNPGLASANLRGLGSGSTLVLIDGRRSANYAFDGGAVDLNSIPLAAIDRIEILKDGASAIYGADAMAGVINFILRKDFTGFSGTAYTGDTEHGGGGHQQATMTVGHGSLSTDRYNAFVTLDWQKDQSLAAISRPFSSTVFIPQEGINALSRNTFPANFLSNGLFYNPSRASGCTPPQSIPAGPTSPRCGFDYASVVDTLPPAERISVLAGATWQVDADTQLFARYIFAHGDMKLRIAPTPASEQTTLNHNPILYPANGPFYPTAFAAANGITGPLDLYYRTVPLGPRADVVKSDSHLLTLGVEGFVAGWNYNAAFIYSRNRETDDFLSGYVSEPALIAAMATGLINPFGPSGPAGDALLASAQVSGTVRASSGRTRSIEARLSKEIYDLPAGPLAMALGTELRREDFSDNADFDLASGQILGGTQVGAKSASRSVDAVFAELNVPVVRDVEAQLAARYDHYSDFGGTVNPKIAVRWQPMRSLLLRSSWGTGFRVPTLYDLYTPLTQGQTGNAFDDPLRCPTTGSPQDCGNMFRLLSGGNPALVPEKSKQFNAGVVWAPFSAVSLGADYWNIRKTNTIATLTSDTVFANYDLYAPGHIVRGPVDPAYPNLPGPIDYVLGDELNLGKLHTSGVDVDLSYRGAPGPLGQFGFTLNGTYILEWQRQFDGVNFLSALGGVDPLGVGAVPRWRHYAALTWSQGPWGATVADNFTLGYTDANLNAAGEPRRVGSYDIWNVQGTCASFKNTTVALGVKNVFDRSPPFSNQTSFTQIGYNSLISDPRGRQFYASVTVGFK